MSPVRTGHVIALATMAMGAAWLGVGRATAYQIAGPEDLYFERYSDRLPERNTPFLNGWLRAISRMSGDEIAVVEGHADEEGDEEWMVYLSRRRAEAVTSALVELGARRDRFRIEAYGDEKPAVTGPGEENVRWNRRCSLVVRPR